MSRKRSDWGQQSLTYMYAPACPQKDQTEGNNWSPESQHVHKKIRLRATIAHLSHSMSRKRSDWGQLSLTSVPACPEKDQIEDNNHSPQSQHAQKKISLFRRQLITFIEDHPLGKSVWLKYKNFTIILSFVVNSRTSDFIYTDFFTTSAEMSDKSGKFSICPAENFSMCDKCPVTLCKSQILMTDMFYEISIVGIKTMALGLKELVYISF